MAILTSCSATIRRSLAVVSLALLAPVQVAAQASTNNPPPPPPTTTTGAGGLQNPLNNIKTLPQFLNAILDAVVQIGTIILILALVYTGFLFVAARGNSEKLQSARSALVWTVIGGLILLGAKAIGLVIQGTVQAL